MTGGFTKLFSSIVTSSLWQEEDSVRLIWITLLSLANRTGFVSGSIPGISHIARVPMPETEMALGRLSSPDPHSRTADYDGRRIEAVHGGWQLLNYEKYRESRDPDKRREQNREAQQRYRGKTLSVPVLADAGEVLDARSIRDASEAREATDNPVGERLSHGILESRGAQDIYNAYPRKVARPAALRAIARALPRVGFDKLMALTKQYAAARAGQDPGLTPHPATWFNQERYSDDPSTWKDRELRTGRVTQKDVEQQKRADSLARLAKAQQELHGQGSIQRVG